MTCSGLITVKSVLILCKLNLKIEFEKNIKFKIIVDQLFNGYATQHIELKKTEPDKLIITTHRVKTFQQ